MEPAKEPEPEGTLEEENEVDDRSGSFDDVVEADSCDDKVYTKAPQHKVMEHEAPAACDDVDDDISNADGIQNTPSVNDEEPELTGSPSRWQRVRQKLKQHLRRHERNCEVSGSSTAVAAGESTDADSGNANAEMPAEVGDPCAAIERFSLVDRRGDIVAEDDGEPWNANNIEASIVPVLQYTVGVIVDGIPNLVVGAADRAAQLLAEKGGPNNVEAAVAEVVAGSERTVSDVVVNFCLERIPFFGCPTVLIRTIWVNLRSVLIIASLYDRDLKSPRTQHEALLCLVPPGEDTSMLRRRAEAVGSALGGSPLLVETAQKVARMMMKGALRQATGLQAAAECFELASLLYNNCNHESVDEDGFVHVMATPASAARDFFKPKCLAWFWSSLLVELIGVAAPALFAIARLAPRVSKLNVSVRFLKHVTVVLLGLPLMFYISSWVWQRRWSAVILRQVHRLQALQPVTVTVLVFSLHALLPAISSFSAVSLIRNSIFPGRPVIGWDWLHSLANCVLGFCSLFTCLAQHLRSQYPEVDEAETASRRLRVGILFFSNLAAAARACCVLLAWMYSLLALDLLATYLFSWRLSDSGTRLEVVGWLAWLLGAEPRQNSLWSVTALSFLFSVVSFISQQRLVKRLASRESLLRLIGAERVTAHAICALLKGVEYTFSHSTSANPIAEFFETVTPPPLFCVVIVALRSQAVVLGAALAILPPLMCSGILDKSWSLTVGCIIGMYGTRAFLRVWYESHEDLDSPALRLALLVPGSVSSSAKGLLGGAIAGARKRAVQMMTMRLIRRIIRWCFPFR